MFSWCGFPLWYREVKTIQAYIKQKGLSAGLFQGCPTIPPHFQTRLFINWASKAAFGLILYVSGPRLRRGTDSVISLSVSWRLHLMASPPPPPHCDCCHLKIMHPACRAHPKLRSKSVISKQTHTHTQTACLPLKLVCQSQQAARCSVSLSDPRPLMPVCDKGWRNNRHC